MEITISKLQAEAAIEALADQGDLDMQFLDADSYEHAWKPGRNLLIEVEDNLSQIILDAMEEHNISCDVEMPEPKLEPKKKKS